MLGCHPNEESANAQIAKIEMEKEKDRSNRQADGELTTGVMVAWYPPPEIAERLANNPDVFPEGSDVLEADDLHVTLAFLGKIDEDVDGDVLGKVEEILNDLSRSMNSFDVLVTGQVNRFENVEDGTVDAVWAEIESEEFHFINAQIMDGLGFENTHGAYTPHLTLAYVPAGETDTGSVPRLSTQATELVFKIGDSDTRIYQLKEEHVMGEKIHYIRALPDTSQVRAEDLLKDTSLPVPFVASTEGVKSDGKDLRMSDWDLRRYRNYGPILWVHDYTHPPLGTGDARAEDKLRIDVSFDEDDPFAMMVRSKAIKGMMGGSVGWATRKDKKNELIEFSMVPVGIDPDAMPEIQRMGLRAMQAEISEMLGEDAEESLQAYIEALRNDVLEEIQATLEEMAKADEKARGEEEDHQEEPEEENRGAIPSHTTKKADINASWDGPGEVAKAEANRSQLRLMHAWVDGSKDPNTKQAYKLPHHRASGEVVWSGVRAAMSRLMQANTQIPSGDRRGVYNHLANHYKQFDKEVPDFRKIEEVYEAREREEAEAETLTRAGAMLSKKNREDLEQALALIKGVLERATPDEDVPSFSAMRGEGEKPEEEKPEPEEAETIVDQRGQDGEIPPEGQDEPSDLDPGVLDQIIQVLEPIQ